MERIAGSLSQLIGKTPLLELKGYGRAVGASARLVAKLEYFNPAGSVKDRVALAMIEDAEQKGQLKPGAVIIEPTSGNTGIGIAAVARARGYRVILTMPASMSAERRALLAAYGAELVLTDAAKGMSGAISKAEELKNELEGAIILGQFVNPACVDAHFATTGPEIWNDTEGKVDILVCGVGTGGTITGTGKYLKQMNPEIKVVAVEPEGSPVLSGGKAGTHGLQGIGAGFVPDILDRSIIDEVMCVNEQQAYAACRTIAATEGVLTGISSGAAAHAAARLAQREENAGKLIVALLPDGGEKYMSMGLFGGQGE